MTITLPQQVEKRLRRKAARIGQEADALAGTLLWEALADEAVDEEATAGELREEYHQLVALELRGELSDAQAARLRRVMQELDGLDTHSPAAQAMSLRLEETGRKLDEMLALLRSLPLAEQVP
jgi:hypothetical protein